MADFEFELEYAELTGDRDRADAALLDRFPTFRPVDVAFFGGWDEAPMLFALADMVDADTTDVDRVMYEPDDADDDV